MFMLSVSVVSASVPSYVTDGSGLYASNSAQVVAVNDSADIAVVYLDNGLDAGLDIGMTVHPSTVDQKNCLWILVATEQYQSTVILDLRAKQVIRRGLCSIKITFRNS